MVDEKVPLQGCPREGCDEPILEAFRTDQPFQLRRSNMVIDKWCIIPSIDHGEEKFWVYVIRHGEIEGFKTGNEVAEEQAATTDEGQDGTTESELQEATTDSELGEPEADDAPDLHALTEFERKVYRFVEKEGTASLAAIQGKMHDTGRSLAETTATVNALVGEHLVEVDEETYEVART